MPIGPINYAMLQRTGDVEMVRHQEDMKPMADQQNIQGQVELREDVLRHQVLDPQNSDRMKKIKDEKEKNGKSSSDRKKEQKKKHAQQNDHVVKKTGQGFDIKI